MDGLASLLKWVAKKPAIFLGKAGFNDFNGPPDVFLRGGEVTLSQFDSMETIGM